MKSFLYAAVLSAAISVSAPASAAVTTMVYSTFTGSGDGSPFSGLVGTLSTPGVSFATDTGFNWHPFGLGSFGSSSTGALSVASGGSYTFNLNSDDGSSLFIDGNLIIDNGGPHGPTSLSGVAALAAGLHTFKVNFFEDFGGPSGVDLGLPQGVVVGVPEPSTWAMLLLGFLGISGLTARRRRRVMLGA